MITASEFLHEAGKAGFDFYTGVPCSFLTPLINGVLSAPARAVLPAVGDDAAVVTPALRAGHGEPAMIPVRRLDRS